MKHIHLYTDGACIGNPGPGGYGVILLYDRHRKELSAGYRLTTNNRMELLAAIVGLETLKEPCQVTLYSDSRYLVENFTKGSARHWQANGWMRDRKTPALNADLWQRLLEISARHQVEMIWVEGHAGNSQNERCDWLALKAATKPNLSVDDVYEKTHRSR